MLCCAVLRCVVFVRGGFVEQFSDDFIDVDDDELSEISHGSDSKASVRGREGGYTRGGKAKSECNHDLY